MKTDFHYYVTYVIAAAAGYSAEESETLAHSCQMTDDNQKVFTIDQGKPTEYSNYISQTSDISQKKNKLIRIYPFFHFMPGDPMDHSAARKDGKYHILNTTPDSENANQIFEAAAETGNLYLLGIACHMLADTFAHANFTGTFDDFNSFPGFFQAVIPNIGHADAIHQPDTVGLVWCDPRLMESERRNNQIFLDAAECLFNQLYKHQDGRISERRHELRKGLTEAFNRLTSAGMLFKLRMMAQSYTGQAMPDYVDNWFDAAVINDRNKIMARILPPRYTWRSADYFHTTDWYKFQEAIKQYQSICWNVLEESVFSKVMIENL